MNNRKISRNSFLKLTAAGLAAAALAACSSGSSTSTAVSSSAASSTAASDSAAAAGSAGTIRYGKSQGPYTELFEAAIVPILEKEGYTVEGTDFSELLTADIALNDGDVDVNVEQHTAYANNFNASYDGDLTPICPIPTVPAGIFSATHTSLDELTDGAKIAVPNDASNTARAYALLQKAGWITLDSSVDLAVVTQDDITENPHNLEFTEMASLNIPSALQDFDYAVITGSIVYNAGIDASTALLTEDVLPQLLLQVVVKKENADTDWAKAIVDAYHSDEFRQYMNENNDGLWYIPDELK